MKDFNIRYEIINILEGNRGENLLDVGLGNGFFWI